AIAKIMPVYVAAIPGLILVLIQLYREATGWETRRGRAGGMEMDEVREVNLDKQTELRRTLQYFGWFIGGAVGIWLLGIVIALPLLVLLYTLIEGREKWTTSLLAAGCTYLLIWGLFEYMLEARWPQGLLFG
ncbi:MAG TPA: tripartite tricarboxylate transporter TctB family protein, partial [Candidatus Binatia bacterium]|nr:tripartite tricarboxylate transporter TctB family protein [Candidatus Binatia bacterium]